MNKSTRKGAHIEVWMYVMWHNGALFEEGRCVMDTKMQRLLSRAKEDEEQGGKGGTNLIEGEEGEPTSAYREEG